MTTAAVRIANHVRRFGSRMLMPGTSTIREMNGPAAHGREGLLRGGTLLRWRHMRNEETCHE